MRRPRLSYANVTATFALVLATSGVGYAAVSVPRNSVGSPQVINNSLTGTDIKEGTLGKVPNAAKLNGQTPVQLRYTGTVPSNVTLKGSWGYDGASAGANDYRAFISYGADFGQALTPEIVQTGTTTHCTGSDVNPTAAAGFVCLYLSDSSGVDFFNDSTGFFNTQFGTAVNMQVSADAGVDLFAVGTWAATAP
jgi:hypothetical protein